MVLESGNALSEEVVNGSSVNVLKSHIISFFEYQPGSRHKPEVATLPVRILVEAINFPVGYSKLSSDL